MITQPTDKKNRLEECARLIESAKKCLENNDKECVMRLIEELVQNQCHNGYAVGSEIVNRVRELVHELWLRNKDHGFRCGLLTLLRDLGLTKRWTRDALRAGGRKLDRWLIKCGINWEGKATRGNLVKEIEGLLRRLGWDEVKMCEELWRFVGVDVNEFRMHGIEPCSWLKGLESLYDLRRPYWLGLRASDLVIRYIRYNGEINGEIELALGTTNSVDAVFFPTLLKTVKTPSPKIWLKRMASPMVKYILKSIVLSFYVDLGPNEWPWPIELSADELKRVLDGFTDEELSMFLAGEIDGDGVVWYNDVAFVAITACKNCPKRAILDILKEVVAKRFGAIGKIKSYETADALVFHDYNAIKLLKRIVKHMHHPLRRLRAELILAYYEGRVDDEELESLYNMTKYKQGAPDVKRNHALEALTRAAPQTHTHGDA